MNLFKDYSLAYDINIMVTFYQGKIQATKSLSAKVC